VSEESDGEKIFRVWRKEMEGKTYCFTLRVTVQYFDRDGDYASGLCHFFKGGAIKIDALEEFLLELRKPVNE